MEPIAELGRNYQQMALVEKWDKVVHYLYPIAQSVPRKHGVVRDLFLRALLGQAELFYRAGKSNQVSKIYEADAGLAHVRYWLRFLNAIRCLTCQQQRHAEALVAEAGGMINAWIKRKGQTG